MHRILFTAALIISTLTTTACGGGGGSKNSPPTNSASSSSLSSTSSVSSSSISSQSSSSSSESSSSTHSSNPYNVSTQSLKGLVDFPIGVAVSAGDETNSILRNNDTGAKQRAIIEQYFDEITPGNIMKMSYLHPDEDNFTHTHADNLVNYAHDHGLGVHAHALIWHSNYQVPDWIKNFPGNKAAWSAMLKTHVQTIASYYAGRVRSWDVVNEAFMDNGEYRNQDVQPNDGQGSIFYRNMGKDYIAEAFINAREADPAADLYYNDFNISPGGAKLNAVLAMVDDFKGRDIPIPIDGIGFQMHVYLGWPSISNIRNSFQAVVERGLKVKITELDIPINNPYDGSYNYPNNYHALFTPAHANQQKLRYCEIVKAYMEEVPDNLRGGITVWGVWDADTWLNQVLFNNQHQDWPLLFDHNFNPKPALQGVANGLTGEPCDAE